MRTWRMPRALALAAALASGTAAGAGAAGTAPAAAASTVAQAAPAASREDGRRFPDSLPAFALADLEGRTRASGEWRGKVLLVDFWATWCAACRETIPALTRLQEKHGARGLSVVGVSLDKGAASKVSRFAKKLKVNYPVLLDPEDTLSRTFGFEGLPSLYLFDRKGRLIKALAGYTAAQDKELEALVAAQVAAAP